MNINEFTALAAEEVVKYLPEELRDEISVRVDEIMKVNDQVLHGLSFHRGDDPAPTFYLDDLFEACPDGVGMDSFLRGLAETYVDAYLKADDSEPGENRCGDVSETAPFPTEVPDMSYKNARRRAGVRLIGMDYNKAFLKTVPYRDVGNGYALIGDLQIKASDGGVFSTVITNKMAEEYNYDMDVIFNAALDNAWKTNAAHFMSAEDVMEGTGRSEEPDSCWVLTAHRPRFGAAALFYPGTQAMIADVLGEDYVAIPSSLHEFIIIRKSMVKDAAHLQNVVKEANSTVVSPDEVLSDNVLVYSRDTGGLTLLQAENGLVHAD